MDKPLPETPQSVRFWVVSDQLCDQFYLIDQELSLLFEVISIYFDSPFQKLPPEIEDGGDVRTELHEKDSEFHVLGDVIVWEWIVSDVEEVAEFGVDFFGEVFFLLELLFAFDVFLFFCSVDHLSRIIKIFFWV